MKNKLFTLAILVFGVIAGTACNDLSSTGIDYENVTAEMAVFNSADDLFPIVEVSFSGANIDNNKGLRMTVEYSIDDNPSQVLCYGNNFEKGDNGTKWLAEHPNDYVKQGDELYVGLRSNYVYYTSFTIPCLQKGRHSITMTFTALEHVNSTGDSGVGTRYTVTRTFDF